MQVKFRKDILEIEDARIIYRNFEGVASKFNREGDRNFAVIVPNDEIKDILVEAGWNVKIKPPRDEDDTPFMFIPVKVKFNNRGPAAYLRSGETVTRLNEETIGILDEIDIQSVSMDLRPYDWDVNGKTCPAPMVGKDNLKWKHLKNKIVHNQRYKRKFDWLL